MGSGRSPGGGNGNPLKYSCLGNPMDSGAWWATVHRGHKTTNTTERDHIAVVNLIAMQFYSYWSLCPLGDPQTSPSPRQTEEKARALTGSLASSFQGQSRPSLSAGRPHSPQEARVSLGLALCCLQAGRGPSCTALVRGPLVHRTQAVDGWDL